MINSNKISKYAIRGEDLVVLSQVTYVFAFDDKMLRKGLSLSQQDLSGLLTHEKDK